MEPSTDGRAWKSAAFEFRTVMTPSPCLGVRNSQAHAGLEAVYVLAWHCIIVSARVLAEGIRSSAYV